MKKLRFLLAIIITFTLTSCSLFKEKELIEIEDVLQVELLRELTSEVIYANDEYAVIEEGAFVNDYSLKTGDIAEISYYRTGYWSSTSFEDEKYSFSGSLLQDVVLKSEEYEFEKYETNETYVENEDTSNYGIWLEFMYKTNIGYFFRDSNNNAYLLDLTAENGLANTDSSFVYEGEELDSFTHYSYIDEELIHYNIVDEIIIITKE